MYDVALAPKKFRSVINPRRGSVKPVPLLSWAQWMRISDELLETFGYGGYAGCASAEMMKRPVPHVFEEAKTLPATQLYERRFPAVLAYILSRVKPPIQPLKKESRLGYPFFFRPHSKRSVLIPYFGLLEEVGPEAMLEGAFIIMNVRLQPEPKSKERDMLFVNDDGVVYPEKVGEKQRQIELPDGTKRTASRTRLVFNMPAPNLYKQVLDTAIHNELISHPAFHHNMFSTTGILPMRGDTLFFDVKHFERHTSAISRLRGRLIGGLYGRIVSCFSELPFLCPSDTRDSNFFLWPRRSEGWSDQFASGDSAVAPLQKELFICLYQEAAERLLGIPESQSLQWVLQGGDERVTIRNYGDDNCLSGDAGALSEVFALIQDYLEAEVEDPPKFLGFQWNGADGFKLMAQSYLLKTYYNERAPYTTFRPYPLFGWVEKRKVYIKYGEARLPAEVFPLEDKLLLEAGHSWPSIMQKAGAEALRAAQASSIFATPSWLLGKEWRLPAAELVSSGAYEGLTPAETRPIMTKLVGPEWKGVF